MRREPYVFLMNFAGHDISDAMKYGKVINLTEGNLPLNNTDRIMYGVAERLKEYNYNPKTDYIAISGSPVLATLITRVLSRYREIKTLNFNAKTRKYYVRHI